MARRARTNAGDGKTNEEHTFCAVAVRPCEVDERPTRGGLRGSQTLGGHNRARTGCEALSQGHPGAILGLRGRSGSLPDSCRQKQGGEKPRQPLVVRTRRSSPAVQVRARVPRKGSSGTARRGVFRGSCRRGRQWGRGCGSRSRALTLRWGKGRALGALGRFRTRGWMLRSNSSCSSRPTWPS